jgi:hypothetical protein
MQECAASMLIQNRRKSPGSTCPSRVERRVLNDRRRDHVTRALVSSRLIAREAENLPDGPARHSALAAMMRLSEVAAQAEQKRLASERVEVKRELRDLALMLQRNMQEQREMQIDLREKTKQTRDRTMILLWMAGGLLLLKLVLP